ncbi:MAG TPA: type II secretion system F family protein [Arenimonas sp.]|nr:type II secretion system F family protein [Arenimonas sp.]
MPQFQYKGRSARGDVVTGRLEADSAEQVAGQLFNTGVTPIEIGPASAAAIEVKSLFDFRSKPSDDDLILFTRQLYALVKAGVPIIRSLKSLGESTRNPGLSGALTEVVQSLESGRDFGYGLSRHPHIFSSLYVAMVRVGESSGRMEESLMQLYDHLQREKKTAKQVKSALRYPAMVLVAIAIAMLVLTGFVIPAFSAVFDQLQGRLPLPTRIIVAISDFVRGYWYLIALATAIGSVSFMMWKNTERGRYLWHRTLFRIPRLGGIILRASLARFARAFSMTYRAGVPLIQALTLVSKAVDNDFLGEKVLQIRNGVERGESLSRTAIAAGLFTPLVIQMLQVGEETGNVDEMLDEVGDYYEREVDYDIANISAIIEPVLIVAMGGMVLVLALGVFLPMWEIYSLALKK